MKQATGLELDILSLIYLKCPEYYGILCNSGTVHAVVLRAVVLFSSSASYIGPRAVREKVTLETEHAWAGLMRALVIQKKNKRLSAVKFCGWLSGAGTGTGAEITGTIEKTQIFRGLTGKDSVEQNDRRFVRLKNFHAIVTAVYRPPAHDLTSRLY